MSHWLQILVVSAGAIAGWEGSKAFWEWRAARRRTTLAEQAAELSANIAKTRAMIWAELEPTLRRTVERLNRGLAK